MSHVTLLFSSSNTIASRLIRAATWSRWSHVGIVHADASVVESVPRYGVGQAPKVDAICGADQYALGDIPCRDPDAIIEAALSQVGKPYDYSALLGLTFHRDWQEDDRWFCSELIAWAFAQAGEPLFRAEALHRITPQHLWMLPPRREDAVVEGGLA